MEELDNASIAASVATVAIRIVPAGLFDCFIEPPLFGQATSLRLRMLACWPAPFTAQIVVPLLDMSKVLGTDSKPEVRKDFQESLGLGKCQHDFVESRRLHNFAPSIRSFGVNERSRFFINC